MPHKYFADFKKRILTEKEIVGIQELVGVVFPPYERLTLVVGHMSTGICSGKWSFMFPSSWLGIKTNLTDTEKIQIQKDWFLGCSFKEQGICVNWPELQHKLYKADKCEWHDSPDNLYSNGEPQNESD